MKAVALLRGINVGGQKKIRMADLRALFEDLGFGEASTYIQSGNVVFDPAGRSEIDVILRAEKGIEDRFGFEVPVILRRHEELDSIVGRSPFGAIDTVRDGTRYLVSFLDRSPAEETIDDIQAYVTRPEKLLARGREVYLHCPNGYGQSKLTPNLLERKLQVKATTRNWRSLLQLHELSKS